MKDLCYTWCLSVGHYIVIICCYAYVSGALDCLLTETISHNNSTYITSFVSTVYVMLYAKECMKGHCKNTVQPTMDVMYIKLSLQ